MNAITQPGKMGAISALFADYTNDVNDELAAGGGGGFAVMSILGKAWTIKYGGEKNTIVHQDSGDARSTIEVVIIKAHAPKIKLFYEGGYDDAVARGPDCFSNNSVTPDPTSPKKQHTNCTLCPHNAWGTGQGGTGKRCQDKKAFAIVPVQDIAGKRTDGPILLRVPAGSFKALDAFMLKVKGGDVPYFGMTVRMSFDQKEPYPKLLFEKGRNITNEEEARAVLALRNDPRTERMLTGSAGASEPEAEEHQVPPVPASKPVTQRVSAPVPVAAPKAAKEPELPPHDPETGEIEEELPFMPPPPASAPKQPRAAAKAAAPSPTVSAPASFDDMLASLLPD